MDGEHVAPRAVEPRHHDDLGTDLEVAHPVGHGAVDDQPGDGRALAALLRGGVAIGEGRLDAADRAQDVPVLAHEILPGTASAPVGTIPGLPGSGSSCFAQAVTPAFHRCDENRSVAR
jgi:hypothetical protein